MPFATMRDIEEFERTPLAQRLAFGNIYDALMAAAQRNPDRLAIRFLSSGEPGAPSRDVSWRDYARKITQSANLFHALGIGPDDVVSLMMPILPESFFCLWGAETAGIANPINYLLEPAQLVGILNEARTRVLVCADPSIVPDIWPKVQVIRAQVPSLKHVLVIGGKPAPDVLSYEAEIDKYDGAKLDSPRQYAFDTVAALFHTGGTTGTPKLAQHTHGGLVTHSLVLSNMLRGGADEVCFNGLPLFHVGGATCGGLSPHMSGGTVVLLTPTGMRNPGVVNNFWRLIERFRPSVVGAVPTSWGALLNVDSGDADISSIKLTNCGGSPMPVEIANAVKRKLNVPVVEGYGMTEVHGFSSMNPAAGEQRIGSVGLRAPYCQIITAELTGGKIVRRLGADEIGVVLMRGPQIFKGYVAAAHNKDAWVAAEAGDADQGRWLNTGDLGRFDAQGYLWLTGRAKDLIIRGGHNIDPIVIEEVLHQHPAVESAAAIGRPDRYAGEMPVAYVQLRPGHKVAEGELQAFARERITERAAAPVEVTVIPVMPITGVGKIFKPALRLDAAQRMFTRLLEPLQAHGIAAQVVVAAHREFGTLASVKLKTSGDFAAAKEQANQALLGLTIRYQIEPA